VDILIFKNRNVQLDYILTTFKQSGFKVFVVGGAVRDLVLGNPSEDVDLLTNASIKDIEAIFPKESVSHVGKTFPICIVKGIEIASGRSLAFIDLFPESDLAKRDFTINSMAYDPFSGELIDPFNGRQDLERKIIRFTTNSENRIKEDPLRMIRACRFVSRINGELSFSSLNAIFKNKGIVNHAVAKERIRSEIIKSMAYEKPSLFFVALQKTGLLKNILPSLDRCVGLDGGPFHKETVFDHLMIVGDSLSRKNPLLRLAGFLHDVGKYDAISQKNGSITFKGHENHYQAMVDDLDFLRFSKKEVAYISSMTQIHMRPLTPKTTPKSARRILIMLEEHQISYQDFLRLRIADKRGNLKKHPYTMSDIRIRLEKLLNEISRKQKFTMNDLEISGHDIMAIFKMAPGSDVGLIKFSLFEKVIDEPELNNSTDLKIVLNAIKQKKMNSV
jgi:tRNA nucleotidyltransferase (CCA-adding enzyme)